MGQAFFWKLEAALPKDHPLLADYMVLAEGGRQLTDTEQDYRDSVEHVFEVIEDWGRGIRDWSEVQDAIRKVKDAG
jgi:hypothetical protein